MLSLKNLRNNKSEIANQLKVRSSDYPELIEKIYQLDEEHRQKLTKFEENKARANQLAKEIGTHFQQGNKEEGERLKKESNHLKEENKTLQEEVKSLENQIRENLLEIPNPPDPSVHEGEDDTENEIVASWEPLNGARSSNAPHWEILERYDLMDAEGANKMAGSGFSLFKGKGAILQRGLVQYFLDKAAEKGYTEYAPPHLVNESTAFGTGQLPDKEGQMYHLESEDLYLIPTAEVPLMNYFRDEILSEEDLPRKMAAHTPCYRREAGSHGREVRGLNRIHQFDKVEIVQVAHPDNSWEVLEEMRKHAEELLKELEIPYRVAKLCSGDLGFAAAFTYDLEAWSPGQEKWLEVSSVSNCTDFQSNRLELRFRDQNDRKFMAHTLNGSALALPRTIAALVENHAEADSIKIPEVLKKYVPFDEIKL